eukprot:GEMP01105319.1.p1 GENE.GEMP01105319.1~~GEMP01105319.1.p1  ORF type:complete len:118 (+),score=0.06 GEMP01105319.1:147-500(+)
MKFLFFLLGGPNGPLQQKRPLECSPSGTPWEKTNAAYKAIYAGVMGLGNQEVLRIYVAIFFLCLLSIYVVFFLKGVFILFEGVPEGYAVSIYFRVFFVFAMEFSRSGVWFNRFFCHI